MAQIEGAIELWGADATRFTCADAGDGILAANYDRTVSDRTILALTTELGFRADGTPAHVNVTHPLWVATKARIDNFVPTAPDSAFDVPPTCHLPRAVAL